MKRGSYFLRSTKWDIIKGIHINKGKMIINPWKTFFEKVYIPVYKQRVAEHLTKLLPSKAKVLDVGCDDGSLAAKMMKINPGLSIEGVDIQDIRAAQIPRKVYDGHHLPYQDKEFDVVMAVDVLHHTKHVEELLREMARVSRKYILIKDHSYYSFFSYYLICFTDFVSNAPWGIKLAFNYLTLKQWRQAFRKIGLRITQNPKNLDYGFRINEKYNPIFLLTEA